MGFFARLIGHGDRETLEQLSIALGGGEVAHRPNDRVWEWRGSVDGIALRVQMGGSRPEASLKPRERHGSFTLERDAALVKHAGDAPADAWSDDEAVRVFVGPGTFLQAFAFAIPDEVAAFERLPAGGGEQLVRAMEEGGVEGVNAGKDEWSVRFGDRTTADQMARYLRLVCSIMAAPAAAGPEDAADGGSEAWSERRMRCTYCQCTFLLEASARCPNCGAPARS